MTLLMFALDPAEGLTVVTDSLVTDWKGRPVGSTTKAYPIPHLSMVMVVTGRVELARRWNLELLSGASTAECIADVDTDAQRRLRLLHADIDDGVETSTAYHFGIESQTGRPVIHVYRSETGFESERIDFGCFAAKPHPDVGLEAVDERDLAQLVQLAIEIQREQQAVPVAERVHIGGDLVLTRVVLDQSGPVLISTKIGSLPAPGAAT